MIVLRPGYQREFAVSNSPYQKELNAYLDPALEVETGFEPVYAALQAATSPLGHSTVSPEVLRRFRADDGIRTRDPHLGKVMRYQLRYVRTSLKIPWHFQAEAEQYLTWFSAGDVGIPLPRPAGMMGPWRRLSHISVGSGQQGSRLLPRTSGPLMKAGVGQFCCLTRAGQP